MKRTRLPLIALALGCAVLLTLPGTAAAQRRYPVRTAGYRPAPNRMPGWDWRRTYPWSPYNYGRNPYNPIRVPYVSYYPAYAPYAAPYTTVVNNAPSYGPATNVVTSNYPPPQPAPGDQEPLPEVSGPVKAPPPGGAIIRLAIPDALGQVYFDGVQTESVGTRRYYVTPALPGGRNLTYAVRATFHRDGQTVSEERRVVVAPGRTSVVDFTQAGS